MNTVKSVYYGWGTLIVAGAGAYYFAKKSINADRAAKAEEDRKKRQAAYQLESQYRAPVNAQMPMQSSVASTPASQNAGQADWAQQRDEAGNPSQEASMDPAPTRHAPEDEGQKMREKSKYEASDVFRSRKGDRFS